MAGEDENRKKDNPWSSPSSSYQEKDDVKLWSIFLFGLIGAATTTYAVSLFLPLSVSHSVFTYLWIDNDYKSCLGLFCLGVHVHVMRLIN